MNNIRFRQYVYVYFMYYNTLFDDSLIGRDPEFFFQFLVKAEQCYKSLWDVLPIAKLLQTAELKDMSGPCYLLLPINSNPIQCTALFSASLQHQGLICCSLFITQ